MTKAEFSEIERYMFSMMTDSAHDREHIYRVLHFSLEIARGYEADLDVLIAAALLHDIGRQEQFADPSVDHAAAGAQKAFEYLTGIGWQAKKADHVKACVATHRFRKGNEPETREARILFDADKLDVTGVTGIARTLFYKAIVGEPLYVRDENGLVSDGGLEGEESFFHEYQFKLKNLYGRFFTPEAAAIAGRRRIAAVQFYENLLAESRETFELGADVLQSLSENLR